MHNVWNLQCVSKKVYTFQNSPHIHISKYFQEILIHVGSYGSLLSNDTKKSDDIVCLSEQEPRNCEIDQNPGLTGIGICFGYQQN